MKLTTVKISEIKPNPNNPRVIKDDTFKKLVQSIKDFPEMIEAREIVVNTDMVILGGNMRFRALREAGVSEVPVKIVDWPEDKQREFVIKDNVSGGEWDWDLLANEWEASLLDSWGVNLPSDWGVEDLLALENTEKDKESENLSAIVIVAYDNINDLDRITSLYELDSQEITEDIKQQLLSQRKVYVFKQ